MKIQNQSDLESRFSTITQFDFDKEKQLSKREAQRIGVPDNPDDDSDDGEEEREESEGKA